MVSPDNNKVWNYQIFEGGKKGTKLNFWRHQTNICFKNYHISQAILGPLIRIKFDFKIGLYLCDSIFYVIQFIVVPIFRLGDLQSYLN